ncbi:hypothetical protein AAC387_Pa05g2743 [Persea americana]
MRRCSSSSSHGNGEGGSFILFGGGNNPYELEDPLASSSVDCTLSLGTPSTRQTEVLYQNRRSSSSSYMSNVCWDIFHTKQTPSSTSQKSGRGGASSSSSSSSSALHLGSDSRLARRCANCDTTSTPLWRNGPRGPKSLCNACGIRYKKEERRATTNTAAIEAHHLMGQHHHHHHHWGYAGQTQMAAPATGNGEFRLIEEEEDDDDGESSSPYLSWRLNVPPPDFPVHMT